MSAKVTEADCLLALSVAKLLGVELDEWQERMLKHMLMFHRQRPADVSTAHQFAEDDAIAPPLCGAPFNGWAAGSVLLCVRAKDHEGFHLAATSTGNIWFGAP